MQGDRVGGVWLRLGCRHQNLRRSKRTPATDIVVADELAAELNMADLRPCITVRATNGSDPCVVVEPQGRVLLPPAAATGLGLTFPDRASPSKCGSH